MTDDNATPSRSFSTKRFFVIVCSAAVALLGSVVAFSCEHVGAGIALVALTIAIVLFGSRPSLLETRVDKKGH